MSELCPSEAPIGKGGRSTQCLELYFERRSERPRSVVRIALTLRIMANLSRKEELMRMMLRWTVPVDKGNAMVNDGSMAEIIETLMKKLQPEAAYFLPDGGERSGMVFFDMKEASDIPGIAEILFQGADAAVEFVPVMNADDLKKALDSL